VKPDFLQFASIFSFEVIGLFYYFTGFPDDMGTVGISCLLGH
jgi:hypothetical protein